jgi:hypothetical protein
MARPKAAGISLERDEWCNGAFTKAMIDGLSGAAGRDNCCSISRGPIRRQGFGSRFFAPMRSDRLGLRGGPLDGAWGRAR